MKKLIMLLFVLALCAPSFGAILVYKQSGSLKGFTFNWNEWYKDVYIDEADPNDPNQTPPLEVDTETLTSAQDASAKIVGYVVMDVNITSLLVNDMAPNNDANFAAAITADDANAISDGVALIIIDKKAKTYKVIYNTLAVNTAKTAWVADANYGYIDAEMHNAVVVLNKKGTATEKTLVVLGVEGHLDSNKNTSLDDPNKGIEGDKDEYGNQEFGLDTMTGALKKVDIDGSKVKVLVPTSLKGHGYGDISEGTEIEKYIEYSKTYVYTDSDIYADTSVNGNASMLLDKKLTQSANESGGYLTTKATVAAIVAALEADDYDEVLPPAIPYIDID
jgi:hypothetical protein